MRVVALALVAGCFSYSAMPNDRADPELRKLADATILDMKVNLHDQPGLCPGKQGKLYVNATVQWPGMRPVMRAFGNDVDSFDPSTFSITGPLIHGDSKANLFPDADVQKSIEAGFDTKVIYTLDPKWSFRETFKPEYSCFNGYSADGTSGGEGGYGGHGYQGGVGQNGSSGENGGRGGNGATGGRLTVYVTIVSTKFYDRLFAVIANDYFFLAPADRKLTFTSTGGQGGNGGSGGSGGNGGEQPYKSVEKHEGSGSTTTEKVGTGTGGNGGNGGNGGEGGEGGNGGTIDITYDAGFPEIRDMIITDVGGGAGGAAGQAGNGGAGGNSQAQTNIHTGNSGNSGNQGMDGRSGGQGRVALHGGAPSSMFRSIRGLQSPGRKP